MPFRVKIKKHAEPNFHIWVFSLNATNNGDCTELTAFICEHLFVCLHTEILFLRKLSVVFIILIEIMNKSNCFFCLGPLLYLFSGKVKQVTSFFASVFLQIKLNTLKLKSIQNSIFVTKNQGPN